MTHNQLAQVAKGWLRSAQQCNPVFVERGGRNLSEFPDAIGFTKHDTIVIECKVSKSDLFADKKKPHRTSGGMGTRRYYMLPSELYEQCKNHGWGGWGIVTCDKYLQARMVRGMKSAEFETNIQAERDFLRSRVLEIQRFGS